MATVVVNLRNSKYDVYIGRAGKGQLGYFGNPIVQGQRCPICNRVHQNPGDTLPCYKKFFYEKIASDPEFKKRVLQLKDKRLGCFCHPRPCHGDVIAHYLDSVSEYA